MCAEFYLEGEHVILQHMTLDDADFILELVNSDGWIKYIGDKGIRNIADAADYIKNGPLKEYNRDMGLGLNLILRKSDWARMGIAGYLQRDYLKYPDLGFAILPQHEGQGMTYEACRLLLDWARYKGINNAQAITSPDNVGSISLLKKLGFFFVKELNHDKKLNQEKIILNLYHINL